MNASQSENQEGKDLQVGFSCPFPAKPLGQGSSEPLSGGKEKGEKIQGEKTQELTS